MSKSYESISLDGGLDKYRIKSIQPVRPNILQIVYVKEIPALNAYGDSILIFTAGDILAATLTEWKTVYFDRDTTVYLSNDGSTYEPVYVPSDEDNEIDDSDDAPEGDDD